MKRGFIPVVVVAVIGLISVLTTGGGYAFYKYNQIAKEKAIIETQLQEEKDRAVQTPLEQESSSSVNQTTVDSNSPESTVVSLGKDIEQTQNKIDDATIVKETNQLSSDTLIIMIDEFIKDYMSILSQFRNLQLYASDRLSILSKAQESLTLVLENEEDPFFRKKWEWALGAYELEMKFQRTALDSNSKLINLSEIEISKLESEKKSIPKYVTSDRYISIFNHLNNDYAEDIKAVNGTISFEISNQFKIIDATKIAWDDWYKGIVNYTSQVTTSVNVPYTQFYQPPVTPQFQVPRLSSCSLSPVGGGGVDLVVRCN